MVKNLIKNQYRKVFSLLNRLLLLKIKKDFQILMAIWESYLLSYYALMLMLVFSKPNIKSPNLKLIICHLSNSKILIFLCTAILLLLALIRIKITNPSSGLCWQLMNIHRHQSHRVLCIEYLPTFSFILLCFNQL